MVLKRPAPDEGMPFGLRSSLRRMRRRPLVCLALSWAAGAIAGYCGGAPWAAYLLPAVCFAALTLWSRRLSALCAAVLFFAACVTGCCAVLPEEMPRQKRLVGGVVCAEPRLGEEYLLLTLDDVSLDAEPYPHRVRLYLFPNEQELPALQYGDRLRVTANLSSPRGATGDGDHDSAAHYWRSGVALTGSAGLKDLSIEEGAPSPMRSLMRLRGLLAARLDERYPEHASLARALLLGDKSTLTDEEYAAFTDAGIVHLLAVSGLHVSILSGAVHLFLRHVCRLSRRAAYFLVLPVFALYAALTGFPASILRALLYFALLEEIGRAHV